MANSCSGGNFAVAGPRSLALGVAWLGWAYLSKKTPPIAAASKICIIIATKNGLLNRLPEKVSFLVF
jgi:hypothetical protein